MKKIAVTHHINGGTNWMECTWLSVGAVATTVFVTPVAGMFVSGYALACWSKVQ